MRTGTYCCSLAIIAASVLGKMPTADAEPVAAAAAHVNELATLEERRPSRSVLSAVSEFEPVLDVGARTVALRNGGGGADLSEDLLRLAQIQTGLAEYEAAENNYVRVIDMRAQEQGIFSAGLIVPYHALGRTYIEARRFEDALDALQRAWSISRRSRGLFNLEQMALIDDMTRAHVESGDWGAARALQAERLDRAIRHFGPDTAELIPFHQHLGDYYANWSSGLRARDQYRKALEISDASYGDSSPESIELLRRLAAVELRITRRSPARDRLAAALAAATEITAEQRGKSLAVLGDWAAIKNDWASAERYYAEAYGALRESEAIDADDFFASPVMLDFIPPWDGVDGAAKFPLWSWGTIELAFDVSETGRAARVRTVALEPGADDLEKGYRKRIRDAHFRPALEQGRPIARSDVSYADRFRYHLSD